MLAESGAILEYLVDRYGAGRFKPQAGTPEFLRYCYWLHYAEGSVMPLLLMKVVFDKVEAAPVPFLVKPVVKQIAHEVRKAYIDPQLTLHFDHMERELGKATWFAGSEFTAADVQVSFPIEAGSVRGGLSTTRVESPKSPRNPP